MRTIQFFEEQTSSLLNNNLPFYSLIKDIMLEITKDPILQKSLFHYMNIYNLIESLLNKYLKSSDEIIRMLKCILDDSKFLIKLEEADIPTKKYILSGVYKNILFDPENNNNIGKGSLYPVIFLSDLDSIFQKLFIIKLPDIYKDFFDEFIHLYEYINK